MLITDVQRDKLMRIFNELSIEKKKHCIRTGIYLQIFMEKLTALAPEAYMKNIGISNADAVFCAREFGFFHEIGGLNKAASHEEHENDSGESIQQSEVVAPIFANAWNSKGYYVSGLKSTIDNCRERWDGSGEPRGLRMEEIPFWGRMCAVADVYDEICSGQHPKAVKKALEELSAMSGTMFDPKMAEIFISCYQPLRALHR